MARGVAGAIRNGVSYAARLHEQLGTRTHMIARPGSVDIFDVIYQLGVPLLIRPLDGILGAYLKNPSPGILVTTQRPLSVQRFTASHELGHCFLNHQPSLDENNVLTRSPFERAGLQWQELEANAFAASFLMPRWLVGQQVGRQGWTAQEFVEPAVVYQLALRLGASYAATCYTLQRYNFLGPDVAKNLLATQVRSLKKDLLAGFEPEDYRGDVWNLTEKDEGLCISGSHNDLFILRLREHSNGGYLWSLDELRASGFVVVQDTHNPADETQIGSPVLRNITARMVEPSAGQLVLNEARPWMPDQPLSNFSLEYDFTGPELQGLSRAERRRALEAA